MAENKQNTTPERRPDCVTEIDLFYRELHNVD